MWRPATSPLFPYTTLFRSHPHRRIEMRGWRDLRHDIQAEMHREAGVRRQDRGGARAEGGRQIVRLQEFREGAPEIGVGDHGLRTDGAAIAERQDRKSVVEGK